ncbi:addiction module protein [Pseudomonadota bacterium]
MDKEWASVANRRLIEMRSGKVQQVPGEEVFERVRNRFAK